MRRREKIEDAGEKPGMREHVLAECVAEALHDFLGAVAIALLSGPEIKLHQVRHHGAVRVRRRVVERVDGAHDEIAGVVGCEKISAVALSPIMLVEHADPVARAGDIFRIAGDGSRAQALP